MTMERKQVRFVITEACERLGIEHSFLVHCIRSHWVLPASTDPCELDEEDLARIGLIRELMEDFGVNDESVPIILHLIDQLYSVRSRIQADDEMERTDDLS